MEKRLAFQTVWLNNRHRNDLARPTDPTASAADGRLVPRAPRMHITLPPGFTAGAWNLEPQPFGSWEGFDTLAAIRNVLLGSHASITRTSIIILELQSILRSTMEAISASQQLIHDSDCLIARARLLGCT